MLQVRSPVSLDSCAAVIRHLSSVEARRLQELVSRKNVVHERSFYVQRVAELADRSVIECVLPGSPKQITARARRMSDLIEAAAVASTALYMSRRELHSTLGITSHRKDTVDFIVGPEFRRLSAASRREVQPRGITVDQRFANRFRRVGADLVVAVASGNGPLATRCSQALTWLLEARLENSAPAAVVKASIAFETLLGITDGEPLRRTLSERAAFLLSDEPTTRSRVSALVRSFYDARSRIVHGGRRSKAVSSEPLLEAAERIALLCLLTLSQNSDLFAVQDTMIKWFDGQRWGIKSNVARSFRPGDLKRGLLRGQS
jgi:hypothetical protein